MGTSKEREEGGSQEKDLSEISRLRNIQRSEVQNLPFNREKKGFFGESSRRWGGPIYEFPRSHLNLHPGPSQLGQFKVQYLKETTKDSPEPYTHQLNCWEGAHEILFSTTDQYLMKEARGKDTKHNSLLAGVDTQSHAEISSMFLGEITGEVNNLPGQINLKQITVWGDPTPIQCDASECSKEAENKAKIWVQENLLRLSKGFGAAFEGCSDEAFALLPKIDQRRAKDLTTECGDKQVVPKEIRNLIFDVNFKNKEPRSESRSRRRSTNSHL